MQAIAAAPAPLQTSLVVFRSRPVSSSALIRPAAAMMAVPCWSSWKTGMSISSRSRLSTMKHSGALMRSEEHTSELQSLMRISYAVFCLKKKKKGKRTSTQKHGLQHKKIYTQQLVVEQDNQEVTQLNKQLQILLLISITDSDEDTIPRE